MGKNNLLLVLKGMAMGIAEIIPGVSGGTIAFITGIYEQLLDSINSLRPSLWKVMKKEGIGAVWQKINGRFLITLLVGMFLGIVVGVFTISHFLETKPTLVWALFFGIIFASIFYMGSMIKKWKPTFIILFLVFAVLTFWVTNLSPASGSENLLFVFLAGFIAISALMLPGISGSFMLLLMGMYTFIVHENLKNLLLFEWSSLVVIGCFGLGCLVGMFSFARILQWTFQKFRDGTLAALTGILLGSLYKIWPWRNPITIMDKETGERLDFSDSNFQAILNSDNLKVLYEKNVLPSEYYDLPVTIPAILTICLGIAFVFILTRMSKPS